MFLHSSSSWPISLLLKLSQLLSRDGIVYNPKRRASGISPCRNGGREGRKDEMGVKKMMGGGHEETWESEKDGSPMIQDGRGCSRDRIWGYYVVWWRKWWEIYVQGERERCSRCWLCCWFQVVSCIWDSHFLLETSFTKKIIYCKKNGFFFFRNKHLKLNIIEIKIACIV